MATAAKAAKLIEYFMLMAKGIEDRLKGIVRWWTKREEGRGIVYLYILNGVELIFSLSRKGLLGA